MRIFDISNVEKHLLPKSNHPAHDLWHGMLLHNNSLKAQGMEVHDWVCMECLRALITDQIPRYALANQMWIGDIPQELAMLTLPEELLIAWHYPKCYVIKLFPKENHNVQLAHLQHAIRGNVSLYNMNMNDVVKMLEGQLMPQTTMSLASIITITYIGSRRLPKNWLRSTFRVRRHVVHDALLWLKMHNPLYGDINISLDRLADLPDDDIPEELLAIMQHEEDENIVIRKSEGCIPTRNNETNGTFEI